ncbi:MAG: hypothetical protein WBB28_04880 [Crinalium sp.]
MEINYIDESKFQQIEGIRQIIVHDHARRFASINLDHLGECGLSWRSDLIEPILRLSPDNSTAWIGVDQQLVALDLKLGRIAVALPLISSVIQILTLSDLTVVLTELEVVLFNLDGSIRCVKGLPDIGSEIAVQGTSLIISLLEGDNLILNIETGRLLEPVMTS